MIFPEYIKLGDKIGITAPSGGVTDEYKLLRLNSAIANFKKLGYEILETDNVRHEEYGQSSDAKQRAKEFMELYFNKDVKAIIAACGGDFLVEILPYIDFEKISNTKPKWIQGYSDITGLTFCITTICDIATIYGPNFGSFGMKPLYKDLENSIKVLQGKDFIQNSFNMYQDGYMDLKSNFTFEYKFDKKTNWINLNNEENITIEGNLLGGCLDILLSIVGTKYDNVLNYIEKYKDNGIVWYLESCELTGEQIIRGLFQLKEAGWFKYVKGFVFGRYGVYSSAYDIDYYDAIKRQLNELNVPIITDVDIGHKPPQLTIINGASARIISKNGKGILYYI